ncbi:anti-adapter protein iraM [Kosakonia sp. MUSA4]|uniref:anti-adapter protein iraM n=1 Tax=Kosakonia sp. MUSA4 TaxID=2067958 RepID=UPI0015976C00|nr:anti-adapter protein iraM [Kosakonia sp. MUSA4]QJT80883.1 anti-adapter protein iraM [Kosakonia sp. MUSA4]
MRWNITEMLVSPTTKTAFALAHNTPELAVIFWYKGNYFLRPDNILHTYQEHFVVNGKTCDFNIIHTLPFYPSIWQTLKKGCHCPGNEDISLRTCEHQKICEFDLCPYGIKMIK